VQEQPKVKDLVELLRQRGKSTDKDIVEILCSIIQFHMLYGGSITDSINYQIDKVKRANP